MSKERELLRELVDEWERINLRISLDLRGRLLPIVRKAKQLLEENDND